MTKTPPREAAKTLSPCSCPPALGRKRDGGSDRRIQAGPALRQRSGRGHARLHGIATIGINATGNGFGPLGTLAIKLTARRSLVIPDAGRGIDQDGDDMIGITEGASALALGHGPSG